MSNHIAKGANFQVWVQVNSKQLLGLNQMKIFLFRYPWLRQILTSLRLGMRPLWRTHGTGGTGVDRNHI